MKKHTNTTWIVLLSVAFIIWLVYFLTIGFLNAHIHIRLPGDYIIWNTEAGNVMQNQLKSSNDDTLEVITIGPDVTGYRVYHAAIVGLLSEDPSYALEHPNLYKSLLSNGYFIINLRTMKVYGGLSKSDWLKKLRAFGITAEPKLFEPSWLDERLGRNKPQANDAQ